MTEELQPSMSNDELVTAIQYANMMHGVNGSAGNPREQLWAAHLKSLLAIQAERAAPLALIMVAL